MTAPCPVCGAKYLRVRFPQESVRLSCMRCGCFGPLAPTIQEAGAEWDRMVSHLRGVAP